AGRAGDRGWTRATTIAAHCSIIVAFALAAWAGRTSGAGASLALAFMGFAAIGLDVGVTADQTLGRRAVALLRPEARGRLNGLYVGLFFLGGAAGSATVGFLWAQGGWAMICAVGGALGLAALTVDLIGGRERLSG